MTGIEIAAGITVADAAMALSTIAGVAGAVQQSNAMAAQGVIAQRNAQAQAQSREYEAKILEQRAGQERAVAQREAAEERRQSRLAQSRGQAVAAASGAGAMDPGVVDLLGDIEAEGEYRALLAQQQGEERARGSESGAMGRRLEADSLLTAGEAARGFYDYRSNAALAGGVARGIGGAARFASGSKSSPTIAGGGMMVDSNLNAPGTFYSRYG